MKTLNKNTKQAQKFLRAYANSENHSIFDIYKNPSFYKVRAEQEILSEKENYNEIHNEKGFIFNASFYRVISGNTSTFTCAYLFDKISKTTGEIVEQFLRVETAYNTYKIIL